MTQKCKTCNDVMEMYYVPWCPRCEKPQRKNMEALNLIQALGHISTITNDLKYKDRIWDHFCELPNFGNDTYIKYWRYEDSEHFTKQQWADIMLFCDVFNIDEKGVLLDISW